MHALLHSHLRDLISQAVLVQHSASFQLEHATLDLMHI